MDLNILIGLLKESGVTAWEVTDLKTSGWEFYFIRHKLDQNRSKSVEHVTLKVYEASEDKQFLGNASMEIPPTASAEEMEKAIRDLSFRARLVKNPYYTLNPGDGTPHESLKFVSLENISFDFIRTMKDLPETATEDINSYEIFVNEHNRRYVNSEGADYTSVYPSSMLEVVVNSRTEANDHEIELYRMYTSGTCDPMHIAEEITNTMKYGRDKLVAENTPELKKAPVLFATDNSLQFYYYFEDQMNASMKYQQISRAEIGEPVVADAEGDRITLKAVSFLPNSSHNFDVDTEGAPIRDRYLIKDGIAENFFGNRQFSQYLGLSESSEVFNITVDGGSRTEEELRTGSYLEAVEFSDFQVDPMTGDIAGEIRLGYWHENGRVKIVSGGSVSGNMREAAKRMYLSSEQKLYDGCEVPSAIRFEELTITGIGE